MLSDKIFAIARFLDQGVLYLLCILSIISIGIIIERFITLGRAHRYSQKVRLKIQAAVQAQNIDDIESLSKDIETIEGRALSFAMKHMKENGSKGLEEIFNTFSIIEKGDLEKSLSFLATMGSNAPYIGLFGTVLGIMKAFNDLAQSPEAGQQTVMAGISVALVATAAGLFVAIPAVIFYNLFQRQVKTIMQNLMSLKELCLIYSKKKE